MKKILLAAMLTAFVAAPLVVCDMHKDDAKKTGASLPAHKHSTKMAKAKGAKTVASAPTNKEKI